MASDAGVVIGLLRKSRQRLRLDGKVPDFPPSMCVPATRIIRLDVLPLHNAVRHVIAA